MAIGMARSTCPCGCEVKDRGGYDIVGDGDNVRIVGIEGIMANVLWLMCLEMNISRV